MAPLLLPTLSCKPLATTALAPPGPAPVLALGHCFYFPALGRVSSLLHCPTQVAGEAWLTPQALVLRFRALPDELYFELDRHHLPTGPAGAAAYSLRCQGRPLGPVSVWYHYTRPELTGLAVSTLRFDSHSRQLRGHVTITAYDARQQLLSGSFEVRATNQADPTGTIAPAGATCTIILAGDFDHLRLHLA